MRKLKPKLLFPAILIGTVFLSMCLTSDKTDITAAVKLLPDVQQFLNEHPDAEIKAALWSASAVEKNIENIREDCGPQMENKSYWKAEVKENDLDLIIWLDSDSKQPVCAVKNRIVTATTASTPVVASTATPVSSPAATIMGKELAANKAIDYINKNLLGGSATATLQSVSESDNLYLLKLEISGKTYDSYVTKDGKLLFPNAVNMAISSSTETISPMSKEAAANKAIDYINKNLLGGATTAELQSVSESANLYLVKLEVSGKAYDSYVTKDGTLLFPNVVNMAEEVTQTSSKKAIGFAALQVKDWTVASSNGMLTLVFGNKYGAQMTLTGINATRTGTTNGCEVSGLTTAMAENQELTLITTDTTGYGGNCATGLSFGESYTLDVRIYFTAGSVSHTDSGTITGVVETMGTLTPSVVQPAANFDAPDSEKPNVKMFVMSFCPYGQQAESGFGPVYTLLGDKITFEPHFVIYGDYQGGSPQYCVANGTLCSMHGVQEVNEDMRQMCIYKYYGAAKFWDYVAKINSGCNIGNVDTCWEGVAKTVAGLDVEKIKTCQTDEGIVLAAAEKTLDENYGVRGSPTIFINEQAYNEADRSTAAFTRAVCSGFTTKPAECSQAVYGTTQLQ